MFIRYKTAVTVLVLFFSSTVSQAVVINELRIDQTGADTDEFFELHGSAGESLTDLSYLVIGDQSSNQGYIESVVDLSAYSIGSDGFFLVAESSFSLHPDIDLVTSLNFENNDNVTHMLVRNFSGNLRDDIDLNDDGIIDNSLWSAMIDSVALLANSGGGDITYSSTTIGPLGTSSPAHIYRATDQTGPWQLGEPAIGISDSPRLARSSSRSVSVPEPPSLTLLLSGLLMTMGFKQAAKRNYIR